jgi:hypothetical protein
VNPTQFLDLIIRPVLARMSSFNPRLAGEVAEALVLGTGLVESGLVWLKQRPAGPALGVYQMEPATHESVWNDWLRFRPDGARLLREFTVSGPMAGDMVWNLAYATAMCRMRYWVVPQALPALDPQGLANYHKQHYNTPLGATDPSRSVAHFARAVDIVKSTA